MEYAWRFRFHCYNPEHEDHDAPARSTERKIGGLTEAADFSNP